MTPADIAYLVILKWHVRAEQFDRILPGEWHLGQYWPAPGMACEASLKYQEALERSARARAREAGCTRTEWTDARARAEALTYEDKCVELELMRRMAGR